jgi:hypothetical protein
MWKAFDTLFSLEFGPGSEGAAFHEIIDLVNGTLADTPLSTAALVQRLRQYRSDAGTLPASPRHVVDRLLDAVITLLLEKDTAIPLLIQKLDDYEGRYFAATMLGWFGSDAVGAIPALIGLASGPSGAAGAAQQAIVRIGGGESGVVSALAASLDYEDAEDFYALGRFCVDAGYSNRLAYLDVLRRATESGKKEIRAATVSLIARLSSVDKQELVHVIEQLKHDPEDSVRTAALEDL